MPTGNVAAQVAAAAASYSTAPSTTDFLGTTVITLHQQYLLQASLCPLRYYHLCAMNYIICTEGIYPPHIDHFN